jgi:hypothetical protein
MDGNMVHDSTRTALAYLWLIAGAVVNILIAGTMTFLVRLPPNPSLISEADAISEAPHCHDTASTGHRQKRRAHGYRDK